MLGLLSKVSIFRRRVESGCVGCELCTVNCPTDTIQIMDGYPSDPSECTMCMECLYDCPIYETTFSPHLNLASWNTYDPDRRSALLTLGAAVTGVAFLSTYLGKGNHNSLLLRPPGSEEDTLLSACVRCGQCIRTCPTGGGLAGGCYTFSTKPEGGPFIVRAVPRISKPAQMLPDGLIDSNLLDAIVEYRNRLKCSKETVVLTDF